MGSTRINQEMKEAMEKRQFLYYLIRKTVLLVRIDIGNYLNILRIVDLDKLKWRDFRKFLKSLSRGETWWGRIKRETLYFSNRVARDIETRTSLYFANFDFCILNLDIYF